MEQKDIRENKEEELQYVPYDENSHESSFTAGNQTFFVFKILLLPNRRKFTEVNVFTTWAIYVCTIPPTCGNKVWERHIPLDLQETHQFRCKSSARVHVVSALGSGQNLRT